MFINELITDLQYHWHQQQTCFFIAHNSWKKVNIPCTLLILHVHAYSTAKIFKIQQLLNYRNTILLTTISINCKYIYIYGKPLGLESQHRERLFYDKRSSIISHPELHTLYWFWTRCTNSTLIIHWCLILMWKLYTRHSSNTCTHYAKQNKHTQEISLLCHFSGQ